MWGKKIGFLVLLSALVSISLFAGPFGLEMGMSVKQVNSVANSRVELLEDDIYELTPPKTNNMFETYVVAIHPEYGVYVIRAIGIDIETNKYGYELKDAYEQVASGVQGKYGEYGEIDALLPGSIWNEPQDWMMGLYEEERFLLAEWSRDKGSTLPKDIESIYLVPKALSPSIGYIVLEYYSFDYNKIEEEEKARQDSVF